MTFLIDTKPSYLIAWGTINTKCPQGLFIWAGITMTSKLPRQRNCCFSLCDKSTRYIDQLLWGIAWGCTGVTEVYWATPEGLSWYSWCSVWCDFDRLNLSCMLTGRKSTSLLDEVATNSLQCRGVRILENTILQNNKDIRYHVCIVLCIYIWSTFKLKTNHFDLWGGKNIIHVFGFFWFIQPEIL